MPSTPLPFYYCSCSPFWSTATHLLPSWIWICTRILPFPHHPFAALVYSSGLPTTYILHITPPPVLGTTPAYLLPARILLVWLRCGLLWFPHSISRWVYSPHMLTLRACVFAARYARTLHHWIRSCHLPGSCITADLHAPHMPASLFTQLPVAGYATARITAHAPHLLLSSGLPLHPFGPTHHTLDFFFFFFFFWFPDCTLHTTHGWSADGCCFAPSF